MDKKKTAKQKKPNPFIYYPVVCFVSLMARLFLRLRVDKKALKGQKGPFVIVANHASTLDIALLASAFLPHRINVVAGKDVMTWRTLRPFLKTMGVITKSQFGLDIAAVRTMCDALKNGCNIALYPEGKASQDGTNLHYLAPSIGKFIKLMGATVIGVNTLGCYNTKRRFQTFFRFGKIQMTITKLFDAFELKTATADEIYESVKKAISFNDNDYQIDNGLIFRGGDRAKAMDFILYKCPVCGEEYQMLGEKTTLVCKHCGNSLEFTEKGVFAPSTPKDKVVYDRIDTWYAWERAEIRKELETIGDSFCFEAPVTLRTFSPAAYKYLEVGEGKFFLNNQNIGYIGTKDGSEVDEQLPVAEMASVCTKRAEAVTLPLGENVWRFYFKEKKYSTKVTLYVEELYRIKHNLD